MNRYWKAIILALVLFSAMATSSAQESAPETIVPTVVPPQCPTANGDAATTSQGNPVTIDVLLNDVNTVGATICEVQSPSDNDGTTVLTNNKITYTPEASFCGTDTFTYSLCKPNCEKSTATVTVTVTCPVCPVANDDQASTMKGQAVDINILGNDQIEGATLCDVPLSSDNGGSIELLANNWIKYTPPAGFCDQDTFTYSLCKPNCEKSTATVTVDVTCPCTCVAKAPAFCACVGEVLTDQDFIDAGAGCTGCDATPVFSPVDTSTEGPKEYTVTCQASGCPEVKTTGTVTVKAKQETIKPGDIYSSDLIADQTKDVGSVTVTVSGSNLIVTFETDGGYTLSATHLYVGTALPNTCSPGQFPLKHSNLGGATSDSYSIPLSSITGLACGKDLYIAAHADVSGSKTAWGYGDCRATGSGCNKWHYIICLKPVPCEISCPCS